jgi:hypothetical protein
MPASVHEVRERFVLIWLSASLAVSLIAAPPRRAGFFL